VPDGSCSFHMVGGVPVVTAPAEIDVTTAGQLRGMLAAWSARGQATVVVDMTGTQFCDSAGLSVLVRAHKQALAQGGGLRLVLPASGSVPRIFTLTGLDGVIPHFAGLEPALVQVPDGEGDPAAGPRTPSPGTHSHAQRAHPGPEE
jgi:anti-sigma B factor antagonist